MKYLMEESWLSLGLQKEVMPFLNINIFQRNQMEVQQYAGFPIFQLYDTYMDFGPVLQEGLVYLDAECSEHVMLSRTRTHLILSKNNITPIAHVEIGFELKFGIIYETQNQVFSAKLGLEFSYNQNTSLKLFCPYKEPIQAWAQALSGLLNQRGFHQMFKPVRKLGKGNFASVYEVQRVTDHKHYAVKAFSKATTFAARNGKQSLKNELSLLRCLKQRNLLSLESVYESENSIYVVMMLLNRGSLFNLIQERKGVFSPAEIRTFMRGLLKGLHHLHDMRIMHRDIKPENIMFHDGTNMEPIIVDFGLATNVDIDEYLFFRCGTPGYVAPEIIELTANRKLEPHCDMFSAGVIFHIMLTGKPLFQGTRYQEVYQNNKQMSFNFNEVKNCTNYSPEALSLLQKMLILNPENRITAEAALNQAYFSESPLKSNSVITGMFTINNNPNPVRML